MEVVAWPVSTNAPIKLDSGPFEVYYRDRIYRPGPVESGCCLGYVGVTSVQLEHTLA